MRILLAIHTAYTDSTSGAAHSLRILMQWLGDGGHDVRVLATARTDARPIDDLSAHLQSLEVPLQERQAPQAFVRSIPKPKNMMVGRPIVDFTLAGVPVTMIKTRAPMRSQAEQIEGQQLIFMLTTLLEEFDPDVVLTYGGHPLVQEILRRARERHKTTVFTLRNQGYERAHFQYVDYVFTASPYLTDVYREKLGLNSIGIESPIDWAEVEAPADLRRFLTFVNPSLQKGSMLFARLADMLGSRRPDIPVLVVQSASGAGHLNAIPGFDFRQYPQIMAAPATMRPSDFFGLTRVLLVPSTVNESFGRVAAEALVNGIPPIVSDRGALPETVGVGGRVLPLPDWMTPSSTTLPTESETQPWFEAVCELWDDPAQYAKASARARRTAEEIYAEPILRQRYLDYFESLHSPPPPLF
jgi:glycosyltransferase involved in cell wall biosynthesis